MIVSLGNDDRGKGTLRSLRRWDAVLSSQPEWIRRPEVEGRAEVLLAGVRKQKSDSEG